MLFSEPAERTAGGESYRRHGDSEVAENRRVQFHRLRRPNQSLPSGGEHELPPERLDR